MYIWLHVVMSSAIQIISYLAAFLNKQDLTFEIQHFALSQVLTEAGLLQAALGNA